MQIAIDSHYGVAHSQSNAFHNVLGPHACDYHLWMKRLKKAFDPDELSDPSFYISAKDEVL